MTSTCPVCEREQVDGLCCHSCTSALERDLGDVPAIVAELDVTISRQARIGSGGKGGLASERWCYNPGAAAVADDLANTLTTWARDVCGDTSPGPLSNPSHAAAALLLMHVPAIRRHPAVVELYDEITDAVKQARQAVDRPADRQYLGTCLAEFEGVTCTQEIFARPGASEARCKVCGITHDVVERRTWLLGEAEDRLFTVREAAQIMGSFANVLVSESTIRSYVSTKQLTYHGKVEGVSVIRLGDLWTVIAANAAKPKGRRLRNAS